MRSLTTAIALFTLLITTFDPAVIFAQKLEPVAPADFVGTPKDPLQVSMIEAAYAREILEKIFVSDPDGAIPGLLDKGELATAVAGEVFERAGSGLEEVIVKRRGRKGPAVTITPARKTRVTYPSRPKRRGLVLPSFDWRSVAFGFQPLAQEAKPEIKMTETDKQIKAEGSDRKSFETKDAKGTRTRSAETTYTKDGKTFGVEIKDKQVIEAVSKPDGKSFRRELLLAWGAEVAACPDSNGVTKGTGKAKVVSKTVYVENGAAVTMTSEFDLNATLTGYVNDQANLTHYDLKLDAYTTNSGYEEALKRNVIKEIKIKDGRYGLRYDIPGNTIEISDGKYGGQRTPAKVGNATAEKLTAMSEAETTVVGSAIGPMVPTIWNSANEMYGTAQKSWRNYGCVEVATRVPKTTLKVGESIPINTETVHLQDGSKVNAVMKAEAYPGQVMPETQSARPAASFDFTQEGEDASSFIVESVSKRGIGRGEVEFSVEKDEKETGTGTWSGTIKVERKHREEREKRSGANLAENGGHTETTTSIQLELSGRLDRTVDAANAHLAAITGSQETVDYEYDRYKVDEGHCGPNAVPYKGPKEITRTSTTTAMFSGDIRVFVESNAAAGSASFGLPETNGSTLHKYVHRSPCSEHDRVNTNEATDEDVATAGGSFSFSFPLHGSTKSSVGTLTVREENGDTTTYRWELRRR